MIGKQRAIMPACRQNRKGVYIPMKERFPYILAFFLLLGIEFFIALFVHDHFVRPYIGDVLVVIVIYCFIRSLIPDKGCFLPIFIFVFAAGVELLQYFHLVELLHLQDITFLRILIGSVFDVADIVCYGVGCIVLGMYEWYRRKR